MKSIINTAAKFAFLLATATSLVFNTALAQNTKKEKQAKKAAETQSLVESKQYVFKANYMTPMRGPGKNLTPDYDVRFSNDSLVSYLPYYGRLTVAPIDPTKNAMEFTSTKYDYTVVPQKKGGWEISIVTRDNRDINKMFLEVSADGYATLRVNGYNQDPISYEGYLEPIAPIKKG